jgi:hypothetical protein
LNIKKKLQAPKWDSLQKHANQRIVNRLMRGVKKGNGIPIMIISIVEIKLHMLLKGEKLFYNKFTMGWLVRSTRN